MKKIIICLLVASTLTGCMGRKALAQKSLKWNLQVTENRWGREGMFIVMLPVHAIFTACDLVIFNSIEFWTDENPLNGKSALLRLPKEDVKKLFDGQPVQDVVINRVDDNSAKMVVDFESGDRVTFDVDRTKTAYVVSCRGVEFYTGQIN